MRRHAIRCRASHAVAAISLRQLPRKAMLLLLLRCVLWLLRARCAMRHKRVEKVECEAAQHAYARA